MKTLGTLLLLITMTYATTATAFWTGKMKYVTTVTYQQGISCEYEYNSQKFWRTFTGASCPSSVEIR